MSAVDTAQPVPPDGELVGAHLHGRPDAFALLYRHYQPRLVVWLARRTADRAAAEDLAHDTLIRALESLDDFDRDRPLWPWLRTIAANLATDTHRAAVTQLPTVSHDAALRDAAKATIDDGTDLLAERELLTQALHTLPDRQRVALSLRYLHDWAPADIGRLLDLNRVSTEQLLFRARRRLAATYDKLTGDRLHGLAWPLLLPLYRLRDRLARLRDTVTNAAPGPAMASAEALATTAAVGALTAAIAVGSLMSPSPSLADITAQSPDRITPVSEPSGVGPAPTTVRLSDPGRSSDLTRPVPSNPPRTSNVSLVPPAGTASVPSPVEAQANVAQDDGHTWVIFEYEYPSPLNDDDTPNRPQGSAGIPCDSMSREMLCEAGAQFMPPS